MALECTAGEITLQEIVDGVNLNETNLTDHEGNFLNPHQLNHSQLAGQTKNDHHLQAHSHNGVDGSGTVSHDVLSDKGAYTHSQIDTHIGSSSNPHSVTAEDVGAATSNHVHSYFIWDQSDESGSSVFDRITVDHGIVTSIGTRSLTPANIGAEKACISGSNSNGHYYKFDDGMMICFHSYTGVTSNTVQGSLYVGNCDSWTYPVSFVAYPSACGSCDDQSNWLSFATDSNSVAAVFSWAVTSQGNPRILYLTAVGRWK